MSDKNKQLEQLKSNLSPSVKEQMDQCADKIRAMVSVYGLVGLAALLEVAEEHRAIIKAGEGIKIEID